MAELAAMRYKDYVWPHNPRVYTIEYHRDMAVQKFPMGVYHLQDLGRSYRVLKGEGEFVGPEAYDQFKELATLFYAGGTGPLIHPVWQPASAYFVELSLRQEPRPDYVSYTFTFWEGPSETPGLKEDGTGQAGESADGGAGSAGIEAESAAGSAVRHTVRRGETLWGIAREYGVGLAEVIALNPQIKNPNLIYPGEEVRVK